MVSKKDIEALSAKLTDKQRKFADNILFLNMPKNEAYIDAYDASNDIYLKRTVTRALESEVLVDYMNAIRQNLEESLLIDRYYIVRNLKKLAETGNENTQLKALVELGKIRGMYVDKQEITTSESPQDIMRRSFEQTLKLHTDEKSEAI
jgi:hypothetical protein